MKENLENLTKIFQKFQTVLNKSSLFLYVVKFEG